MSYDTAGIHSRFESSWGVYFLVLILVIIIVTATALALLGVLPLDTAGPAAAEGRLEGEVNVLLGVQTDNERRNIHDLDNKDNEL